MGHLMSTPVTEKNITLVQHDHISHAIGEMQGYRFQMEDAYCDLNDTITVKKHNLFGSKKRNSISSNKNTGKEKSREVAKDEEITNNENDNDDNMKEDNNNNDNNSSIKINIYGVFDGHGGTSTSKYVSETLPLTLKERIQKEISKLPIEQRLKLANNSVDPLKILNFPKIIKDCFMKVDSTFYYFPNNNSGSTAVVVILFENYTIVANSGDSRCVLSANGATKNLSFDHKPKNLGELMRIHNDGGYVASNRVNSILALSRAFGDFNFKMHNNHNHGKILLSRSNRSIKLTPPEEYQVTVEPDIFIHRILKTDEFLIIACDGIWDCYKSHDLVELIRHQLSLGKKLTEINELILDNCIGMANTITGIGFDNMTIIIVALHEKFGSLDKWHSYMKNKVLDEKFGKLGH